METKRQLVKFLVIFGMLTGCTEQRDEMLPDDVGEDIYPIAQFQDQSMVVDLSDTGVSVSYADSLRAEGESERALVRNATGLNELRPMFDGLLLNGSPGSQQVIRLAVDKKFITASKVVRDPISLSTQERQISNRLVEAGKEIHLVPVFKYEIKTYGILTRKKNDLDEETHILRLRETTFEKATHIQVKLHPSYRQTVSVPASNRDEASEVFVRHLIHGKIYDHRQIQDLLGVAIAAHEEELFMVAVRDRSVVFFRVKKEGELETAEASALSKKDQGDPRNDIARCGAEVSSALPSSAAGKDCVLVKAFEVPARQVAAELAPLNYDGSTSSEVRYRDLRSTETSPLIKITQGALVSREDWGKKLDILDPSGVIVLENVQGKEFLFRRTLQDSPNGFDYTFAGASGDLEIVRFVFESDAVRVVRSRPLLSAGGNTSVDRETLLSIPADYYQEIRVDGEGRPLDTPRLEKATPTDAGAIAYVSWAKNSIPNVSSALNYYALEQCFRGASEKRISAMDHRLRQNGILNFSLETTYSSSLSMDCVGIGSMGYFDRVQANYTFKERFSFKEYSGDREEPLLSLPYEAQKKLGFGLFTYSKKQPNKRGNVDTQETKVPLPAVFDLRGGRQVTYVLAGLPSSGELRDRLITAAREVFVDLNDGFRRALRGTPQARKTDALVLKVEGDSDAPKGVLGDLDVNYIYYVQKRTNATIIGLGGAHSNPRSGEVEAASSFIYGGNILSFVERVRDRDSFKKAYQKKTQVLMPKGASVPEPEEKQLIKPKSDESGSEKVLIDAERIKNEQQNRLPDLMEDLRGYGQHLSQLTSNRDLAKAEVLDELKKFHPNLGMAQAFQKAVDRSDARNVGLLESLINEELLQTLAGKVSADELSRLRARTNHTRAKAQVMDRMRDANICVFEAPEAGVELMAENKDLTDTDILISIFKPTLAHEVGHNIGLRHNFIASYDEANHRFGVEDESTRNYSSVMDYMPNDHLHYDGLGPQDVMALRAAYAQMIELDEKILSYAQEQNGSKFLPIQIAGRVRLIPLWEGKLIRLDDYRQLLGLSSWMDLTDEHLQAAPIKKYAFCSDEDAGYFPTCMRFDEGTSPEEIVQNHIDDYRSLYAYRNFANRRLEFGWGDFGQYLGKLSRSFLSIRQFLEETVYLATQDGVPAEVNRHVAAAVLGMQFFHEVIRTPEASSSLIGDERFMPMALPNGAVIQVERKWTENLVSDLDFERLSVRGIEYDKVFATMFLTERRLGFPRYEKVSLRVSYPEFERMLIQPQSPLELPTVELLGEILSNQVRPAAATPFGLLLLGPSTKVKINEMIRFYALLGSVVNLDVDGMESSDNVASLFKVLSSAERPQKIPFVREPGSSHTDETALNYFAHDSSDVAFELIGRIGRLQALEESKEDLDKKIQEWFAARMDETGGSGDLATISDELDQLMAALPESLGLRTLEEIEPIVDQILEVAKSVEEEKEQMSPRGLKLTTDNLRVQLENSIKELPILALFLSAAPVEELQIPVLKSIRPFRPLETHQGLMFRNLEMMNTLFYLLHDKYQ